MAGTKIAAQMFTVRDFTQTPEDFKESIKRLKEIGYDAVQISGIGKMDAGYIQEVLRDNEMEVCATHTPPSRILEDLDQVIAEHKLWNCMGVGLGSMPGGVGSREKIIHFCNTYRPIAEKLNQEGLKFYYHNHASEFERYEGENVFEIIESCTDSGSFKFLVDVFWLQVGGVNPVQFIEKHKNRIDLVHLKDLAIVEGKQMTAELGLGNMDIEGIVEKCEAIGVRWYAIEQDNCLRNPFESLSISLKYLQSLGIK